MIIRPETNADADQVYALVAAAFGQTPEADLVRRLTADGDAEISLVAEDDGQIIGHVLFSRMTAPFPALALAPVSVGPSHQRRGVGDALIREGVARARRVDWSAIFVLGDPAYYGRFGFDPALTARFASPYAGPHFMALPLGPALPALEGALRHAPAFSALDEEGQGRRRRLSAT